jgi:uncharacterized repeat protein (TIGR03803 family)
MVILLTLPMVLTQSAQAQTFNVIHTFTGGNDGGSPTAGLTLAGAGNLYGSAQDGGEYNYGLVFRLTHKGSGWALTPLYSFQGGNDGATPEARVIIGPNGILYGTTTYGGSNYCKSEGCGTVFNLRPPVHALPNVSGGWMETVLYRFSGYSDGASPAGADLAFDQAGDIYGTTQSGANGSNYGIVYELTPSYGNWTQSVLYAFMGGNDGSSPYSGVIFDNAGNLYGTTEGGGVNGCAAMPGCGTVFQLVPSGSGWTENILYKFTGANDGGYPLAGLIFDQSGNLYGANSYGGAGGGGTVFELTPSGGRWTYKLLYSFTGGTRCGPWGTLVMDTSGNLYGTTYCDGANGAGSVFKLTPSGGTWTYTSLHDFTYGSDGGFPISNVVFDANGNLYGTASGGGTGCNNFGCGVVWEITP